MALQPQPSLTPGEYLAIECQAEYKSEYLAYSFLSVPYDPYKPTLANLEDKRGACR
jgi:hypothetical protein